MDEEEARLKFGKRIQRCYGCFVAYFMRDMWLAEDAAYYCEDCKDEERMFHFDDFSRQIDLSQLPSFLLDESENQRH